MLFKLCWELHYVKSIVENDGDAEVIIIWSVLGTIKYNPEMSVICYLAWVKDMEC